MWAQRVPGALEKGLKQKRGDAGAGGGTLPLDMGTVPTAAAEVGDGPRGCSMFH